MTTAPEHYGPEFLAWLKEATERAWDEIEDWARADFEAAGLIGARWRRGTRWTGGLPDAVIDELQQRYSIDFPPEHRLFLQTLHSTTPWQRGVHYGNGRSLSEYEQPGFLDWLRDEEQIRSALDWPFAGLLGDADRPPYWHSSWGPCPADPAEQRARMIELSPPLIPIFGHRYVVGGSDVVLSIYDRDVIVYGNGLRDYLLSELSDVIDTDGLWQPPPPTAEIPFWQHVIDQD